MAAQSSNSDWSTLVQQPTDPQAFDVESPQDEEAAADREQAFNDNEERSTIDETISLASAPPGELGLIKAAKKAPAADEAPKAKKMPGELGLAPPKPAEKEAPAAAETAENEGDSKPEGGEKPIPAELGLIPKKPKADTGDANGDGNGDANKGDEEASKAEE